LLLVNVFLLDIFIASHLLLLLLLLLLYSLYLIHR